MVINQGEKSLCRIAEQPRCQYQARALLARTNPSLSPVYIVPPLRPAGRVYGGGATANSSGVRRTEGGDQVSPPDELLPPYVREVDLALWDCEPGPKSSWAAIKGLLGRDSALKGVVELVKSISVAKHWRNHIRMLIA